MHQQQRAIVGAKGEGSPFHGGMVATGGAADETPREDNCRATIARGGTSSRWSPDGSSARWLSLVRASARRTGSECFLWRGQDNGLPSPVV
jgi:hypothetical protein